MFDGTAKINLAKPESPYDMTPLGAPFHISPEMYQYHGRGHLSYSSYEIYVQDCSKQGNNREEFIEMMTLINSEYPFESVI